MSVENETVVMAQNRRTTGEFDDNAKVQGKYGNRWNKTVGG